MDEDNDLILRLLMNVETFTGQVQCMDADKSKSRTICGTKRFEF